MKSIISSVIYTSIPVSKVIFFRHIKSRIELQNQWPFFSSFVMEIIPNVSSYTTVSNYITKSMTIPSCLELHRIIPRISSHIISRNDHSFLPRITPRIEINHLISINL